MPQELCMYKYMTVIEQISFFGKINECPNTIIDSRCQNYLNRLGLAEVTHNQIGTLSMGQQRRISLICALLHSPTLILL